MDRRVFIYYRLAGSDLAAAGRAVLGAQQALRSRHPGLETGWMQRPELSADGFRTVMETYAMNPREHADGIDAALQAEIEVALRAAVAPWVSADARHAEVFESATPCAS